MTAHMDSTWGGLWDEGPQVQLASGFGEVVDDLEVLAAVQTADRGHIDEPQAVLEDLDAGIRFLGSTLRRPGEARVADLENFVPSSALVFSMISTSFILASSERAQELDDSIQDGIGRAGSRDVNIDRDDLVQAAHDVVGAAVDAARHGAGADGDDELGLGVCS